MVGTPHEIEVVALAQREHRGRHHALGRALHQFAIDQRTRDCLNGRADGESGVFPLAEGLAPLLESPADGVVLQWCSERERSLLTLADGCGVGERA